MQDQRNELRQIQKLKLTPQLLQIIKIMAMPLPELKQAIQEEVERNPALEIIDEKAEEAYNENTDVQEEESYFAESSDAGYLNSGFKDADAKQKFIEGVLSRPETLHEHLLWQLRLQPIPEDWRRLGELLILNLNDNGFYREPPENIIKPEDQAILPKIISLIQGFDPVGTCTANYREALLVQARLKAAEYPLAERLIKDYLPLLEKGKFREIAKSLGVKEGEILNHFEFIKTLEPYPGRNYSTEQEIYVIPDLKVKMVEGELVIVLNEEEIPVLGVNPFFAQIHSGKDKHQDKALKNFVNTKINEAKWFIKSINQRNTNLLKVCKAIVEFQRDFFRKGPQYLVPLTLKDIAAEVGLHEATVSRLTSGKYVQTEWGIFELKYFFTNSIAPSSSGGTRYSKEGVKQILKELILKEARKLSDQEIVKILANRGIKIARRTVSKYRQELGILSSFERKTPSQERKK